MGENAIRTKHNLDFEVKPFHIQIEGTPANICFRVGTCRGMYAINQTSIDIIAIENHAKGNGHLDDVFEWFEFSCKQNKLNLRIMEFLNKRFKKHLILKRGFQKQGTNNVIKFFR